MRHGGHHPKTTGTGGFTLAELLVVIAIIAIMFAIALPAFVNMTGASKLDAAANAVHSAAKLARQYAITHNQPTYLVFNDDQSTSDANLAYRSYAVFTIDTHTQPVAQSSGEFLTDWETLPSGIVFDSQTTENQNNVFIPSSQSWSGGFTRDRRLFIDPHTYVALGFKPQGTQQAQNKNDIYLAEGFYDETGNLVPTSKQGKRIRLDSTAKSQITSILYDQGGSLEEQSQ
ncbi:MAG: prepilin-type N-terminal cleavage/methylation domain-containing protein [Kiritimatiellales bacterium]|nr:prepilin-type N-terminal cleavage/methylation domain-containing protein [Kiritimatiellales bacterium]